MRSVLWLVVLFAAATALALFMGGNDAVVALFWAPWRIDVSLNVFILSLIVLGLALYVLLRGLDALLSLPERARLWRAQRRDLHANNLLHDAVLNLMSGRYTRAQKCAAAAVGSLHSGDGPPSAQRLLEPLAWLIKAESAHRLQDRVARDEAATQARTAAGRSRTKGLDDAASLRAAAWALDDWRANEALTQLEALPPGLARRTAALRLRLKAARLAGEPNLALHTAHLLHKHQGFGPRGESGGAALLRRLAQDTLSATREPAQLRRAWLALDVADRRDPFVVAHAAQHLARLGDAAGARQWLGSVWTDAYQSARKGPSSGGADLDAVHARSALARAFVAAREGVEPQWLAWLEAAAQAFPREATPAWAAGMAFDAAGLWGKARQMLQQAVRPLVNADGGELSPRDLALAWQTLGAMAERDGDAAAALNAYKQAASSVGVKG
jgi:HemY protein